MNAYLDAIILAGGASRRLKQPKQLLPLEGKSLLRHTIEKIEPICDRIHVVLGAHIEYTLRDIASYFVLIHHNPEWKEGMASTIRTGVGHLDKETAAVMILLVDQPLIPPSHFQNLRHVWKTDGRGMVVSAYNQRFGAPALFTKNYFPLLQSLKGDRGMRDLFQNHSHDLQAIPCKQAYFDVDTPEDAAKLKHLESLSKLKTSF